MGISSFNQPHSGMRQLKIEAEFIHIDLKFMSIRISVVKQNNQILPQLFFIWSPLFCRVKLADSTSSGPQPRIAFFTKKMMFGMIYRPSSVTNLQGQIYLAIPLPSAVPSEQ